VQQNVVTYLVQVKFNPGATPVKLGMTANTDITVQQVKNVLLVPNRAIQTQGQNHSVQVIYSGSKLPINVAIQTGATNGTETEVVGCTDTGSQCLREGDELVLPATTITTRTTTGGGFGGRPGGGFGGGGFGGGVFVGR
jgi:multidrug efflux pump subunit AcrA (membrane-fusion protein)